METNKQLRKNHERRIRRMKMHLTHQSRNKHKLLHFKNVEISSRAHSTISLRGTDRSNILLLQTNALPT